MKPLDLGPDPHWSKMLGPDPDPQWIQFGTVTMLLWSMRAFNPLLVSRLSASPCSRRVPLSPASSFKPCCPSYVQKYWKPGSRHLAYEFTNKFYKTKTNHEIFAAVICHVFFNLFRRTGTRVPHPGAGPGWKSSVRSSPSFLSSSQVPVLRIQDVYPGFFPSRIRVKKIPGSASKN